MQLHWVYKWRISKKSTLKIKLIIFFDDMIVTNLDLNLLKIDKKLYKNIGIYNIGYITMKDSHYVIIDSVNPLYLIIDEADEHFE